MPVIKSFKDLENAVNKKIIFALEQTQEEIYNEIQGNITEYYNERVFEDENGVRTSTPAVYQRTYQFLNSLIKTAVEKSKDLYSCEVKIDDGLKYAQPAEVVIDMINRGFHSDPKLKDTDKYRTPPYIRAEGKFWDDALKDLGDKEGIYELLKQNLIKSGLNIEQL